MESKVIGCKERESWEGQLKVELPGILKVVRNCFSRIV
jgi:hypothetical protein